ncbi:MAG: hypothetical protein IJ829_04650 [Kiritimatiellae bacterium]|nr:hypothetical protein [Kiritimatiellia bacterium]
MTDLFGKVCGVGPENVEVDAPFVQGNSGSAVLNAKGEVIGVATFATLDAESGDWVKKDSRYSKVRRWAVRIVGAEWKPMKFLDFYAKCVADEKLRRKERGLAPQVNVKFIRPSVYFHKGGGRNHYVESRIEIDISGNKVDLVKTPVIRVCILVKGQDALYFGERVLVSPNANKSQESPPVYEYGNQGRGSYVTSTGLVTYFIEGLSYWNGVFSIKRDGRKRKYYDVKSGYGNRVFRLNEDITGVGKPPEIL